MTIKDMQVKIAASFYDDPKFAVYKQLNDWRVDINSEAFGSIIRKNGKHYFNSTNDGYIELDLDDAESIGNLIIKSIAKQILEVNNET